MLQALLMECDIKLNKTNVPVETLYFGGGTPSFMDPADIRQIIDNISLLTGNQEFKELTLEANPDDMSLENLEAWKAMGITRFSVGVQSFDDQHLKWMNRAHNAQEAETALRLASNMGFDLSIDLIFGIPGSSVDKHLANIEKALSFSISHLSCYGLTLEDNTPWKKLINTKSYPVPDEAVQSEEFEAGMKYLKSKGWVHYEISNFSLPGKSAIHNTAYWQNKPYIGIGPSAHSYDGFKRSWNISDNRKYVESIQQGIVPEELEVLTDRDRFNEYVMTGLRTIDGVHINELMRLGADRREWELTAGDYISRGQMSQTDGTYVLTDEGRHFADAIAASFFK